LCGSLILIYCSRDYYNFDTPSYPDNPFESYLNRADVKAALHVAPSFVYSSGNGTVEEYLLADWMQSVQPLVTTLLNNYPVLMYNGPCAGTQRDRQGAGGQRRVGACDPRAVVAVDLALFETLLRVTLEPDAH
jgi:hypothetical protein